MAYTKGQLIHLKQLAKRTGARLHLRTGQVITPQGSVLDSPLSTLPDPAPNPVPEPLPSLNQPKNSLPDLVLPSETPELFT